MSERWAIWLSIEGDLRFLSHHDVLRAIERLAARAELALAFSQGFNPRPILSLIPPRPVGVASRDDLLVVKLAEPTDAATLCDRLNAASPPAGMRFLAATVLPGKVKPQVDQAHYQLAVPAESRQSVADRLDQLNQQNTWPVVRAAVPKRRERPGPRPEQTIDIHPFVADIAIEGANLQWTQRFTGDRTARPKDVLNLLGLDERTDMARLARRGITYVIPGDQADAPCQLSWPGTNTN